ncbi:MAG TPA: NaeI family type II restriction endonuclease [Streptosporangiaceae bacterium]
MSRDQRQGRPTDPDPRHDPFSENALIRLPEPDVAAVFALLSGQQRVNELFRRAQRMRISRTVVTTVAMQED